MLAAAGLLGLLLPTAVGGAGVDSSTLGMVHEEVGRACSSLRSFLTVHGMVAQAIHRWGSAALRDRWLPDLASGRRLAAFALSEPDAGSDAASIRTEVAPEGSDYLLCGRKTWITLGQYADVFLVFARSAMGPVALLVERDTPGLTVTPIDHVVGTRASMLATLDFANCRVPAASRLGGPGFGLSISHSALELGRLSVAFGSVGIQEACLDATVRYAQARRAFGRPLGEQPLVLAMMTEMAANVRASRTLCEQAARRYDERAPSAGHDIFVAKYFASRAATRAANDAVQLHGANGLSTHFPVERYLRDARVTEVIEAPTQVLQTLIAQQEMLLRAGVADTDSR